MAKKKKKVPGLNASSTADISFILLIFFLITTSMDTDSGLARRLPQPPDPDQEDAQIDVKEIDLLGPCYITDKHVISVQTDRGTPYDVYFNVQNELVAAYNELREELSKAKFGRSYEFLTDEQKVAIRTYYPQKISEAEPRNYGGNK